MNAATRVEEFGARRMQGKLRKTENRVIHSAIYTAVQWQRSGKRYL